LKPSKLFFLGLVLTVLLSFSAGICSADHTFSTRSTQADGELKSSASTFGQYEQGEKSFNRGALGGGERGYEWALSSSGKTPGKRGARGAVDGVADSGSAKGNTFTTTVLDDFVRVGQEDTPNYMVYKGYLSFNTSALDYNTIIKSMDIIFYGKEVCLDSNDVTFDVQVLKSIYTEPLWNPDWGSTQGTSKGKITVPTEFNFVTGGDPNTGENIIHIGNATLANAMLIPGGITKIALVSSKTVTETLPSGREYVKIYTSDATNKALRPRLEVQYDEIYPAPVVRPLLTWLPGDPLYNSKGVSSDEIFEGTNSLSFKVRYIYDDGDVGVGPDPNNGAQLFIDLNNNTEYDAGDTMLAMQEVDPTDTDYSDGKDYQVTTQVVTDGTTNIGYQFLFSSADGRDAEGLPATKNLIATIQTPVSSDDSSSCFISSIY